MRQPVTCACVRLFSVGNSCEREFATEEFVRARVRVGDSS